MDFQRFCSDSNYRTLLPYAPGLMSNLFIQTLMSRLQYLDFFEGLKSRKKTDPNSTIFGAKNKVKTIFYEIRGHP